MMRAVERVLVVDDNAVVRRAMVRLAHRWTPDVTEASCVETALAVLERESPDLVLLDVRLSDGSGLTVADRAMRSHPAPVIVAVSGKASSEEAFRLASLGVRGYVPKPLHRDSLSSVIQAALEEPPPLDALASSFVGYASLPDVQGRVRKAMLDQAMALSEGNRSRAAELLGVSRQAVQQSLHRRGKADYEEPAS